MHFFLLKYLGGKWVWKNWKGSWKGMEGYGSGMDYRDPLTRSIKRIYLLTSNGSSNGMKYLRFVPIEWNICGIYLRYGIFAGFILDYI